MRRLLLILIIANLCATTYAQSLRSIESGIYAFNISSGFSSPTVYIKDYVTREIEKWQVKDMYETTSDYQKRVTVTTRKAKIDELVGVAEAQYIKEYSAGRNFKFARKDYDADNQTFLFSSEDFGDFIVKIPIADAPTFANSWKLNNSSLELYVDGAFVKLKKAEFTSGAKKFVYDDSQKAIFARTEINAQFPGIELTTSSLSSASGSVITDNKINIGSSDVDINIPETTHTNSKTYAVIIANENYTRVSAVPFANNDGKIFEEYCRKTLGIPQENIRFKADATLNDIRHSVDWLCKVQSIEGDDANVIFYYAGHGIPNESTNEAYILPVDGYSSDYASGYPLKDLYSSIGGNPAASITYFVDACFSGAKREEGMLATARGVAIKPKAVTLSGNAVAFTASSGDQTAYPYNDKGHGMFTYYLLKKLQESKGSATYGEISRYIFEQVGRQSLLFNSKEQTPSVISSSSVSNSWEEWSLR